MIHILSRKIFALNHFLTPHFSHLCLYHVQFVLVFFPQKNAVSKHFVALSTNGVRLKLAFYVYCASCFKTELI